MEKTIPPPGVGGVDESAAGPRRLQGKVETGKSRGGAISDATLLDKGSGRASAAGRDGPTR